VMASGVKIGVLIQEGSITLAEVRRSGKGLQILRTARCAISLKAEDGNNESSVLAIRQCLREHGFSGRQCVVGLDGQFVAAREKILPAGGAADIAGMLNLAAEREFGADRDHLIFDYCGPWTTSKSNAVQLAAASKPVMEQSLAALRGAGLKVTAIVSIGLALSDLTTLADGEHAALVRITDEGAEIILREGARVNLVRWAPLKEQEPSARLAALCGELRRILAAKAEGTVSAVRVWRRGGRDDRLIGAMAERLPLPVKWWELPAAQASGTSPGDVDGETASLMAEAAMSRALRHDFSHSKMATRSKQFFSRKRVWAAVAAVAVIVLGIVWWSGTWESEGAIATIQQELEVMKPSVQTARELSARVEKARGWFDRRPQMLECLRELTLAFPEKGGVWVTSLALGDDQRGVCAGRADTEGAVLELLDRLRSEKKFSQVKPQYIRQGSGGALSFAFSFNFTPREQS
jgi:hypothetical protein